jgi:hypothetical protein
MRIRDPLIQFVKTQLGPLDMVAIMYPLMSVQQLTFTRDLDSIVAELRNFEGRKYDYRPRNPFEEQYANYPAQAVETVRNEVTMTALRGLSVSWGRCVRAERRWSSSARVFIAAAPQMRPEPRAAGPGQPGGRQLSAGGGSLRTARVPFRRVDVRP